MIGVRNKEVFVLTPPTDPSIVMNNKVDLSIITGIVHVPQTLKLPAVQEIVAGPSSNRTGTNRTPRQISRTGIDRTIPVPSGISGTSAFPPSGGLWSPIFGNIWQSTSPNFSKSNEFNASVNRNFSNDPIAPLVITHVFGDKLSYSYSSFLYKRCKVNLVEESVNPVAPKLVNHWISSGNV